jgi:hypothetical protein
MAKPLPCLTALLLLLGAGPAAADDASGETRTLSTEQGLAYEDRIAELERTVKVLADELERTRAEVTVPEEPELVGAYGLGPAASKVYGLARGLSIGGYGEGYYRNLVSDEGSRHDTADFLRAVLYVGYKFTDSIVFNSEIEIEHVDEIFLEFATLDFLWRDWINAKAGLLLLPMGWLNEIHEPPFYFGVNRPSSETVIIPSTWRENGAGLFGNVGEQLRYKIYAVNGMNAAGFRPSGLRDGRQKGSQVLADDLGVTARLDWTPLDGLILGASVYAGNSGQDQEIDVEALPDPVSLPDTFTTVFDVHAQYNWRKLWLRGLYTMAFVSQAGQLSDALQQIGSLDPGEAVASGMLGGYGEVAYDIWSWFGEGERRLEPFYRFEYTDTQWNMPSGFEADDAFKIWSHTVGFSFEPIPNVVIKVDYRNLHPREGQLADEFNLGLGYVF